MNFYQLIPLYKEEMEFKLENSVDELIDKCPDEILEVINPTRLNAITDEETIGYRQRQTVAFRADTFSSSIRRSHSGTEVPGRQHPGALPAGAARPDVRKDRHGKATHHSF